MKVIITGATGMVGEGVLMECMENPKVSSILHVGRKPSGKIHSKLTEYQIADFFHLKEEVPKLSGYDACFYCAGTSSAGMNEKDYAFITLHTTLHFAEIVLAQNPEIVFVFISGARTDSSGKGKVMWARVKGKAENALMSLPFKAQYNFRPGLMKPTKNQTQLKGFNRYASRLYPLLSLFLKGCSIQNIGRAMINAALTGYNKKVLEVPDIILLANRK
ncbi:NAD-dependent epimerase/dehydratase family protein [Pedobacter metabolipauper]|uniref:NAD-dependent epimerase/dehydratase family protein n=1 Tax=Pedobacter metabolipauper TaxID=425513 RepID=A0A4R6T063_9SPHI|nr:NAD-dependent epimerase/dehydratase family protein [Pedobacter metabolipauper]TDQ10215.1 NAD-dependent epimerase/dehydratase family protein [Pedobacter metabolipauper]